MNLSNLKNNSTESEAPANATNARETSRSVRKIHLWFDIFTLEGYCYYGIRVTTNDNLTTILYHLSRKNFTSLLFAGE
jgi:hypothetical protein